MENKQTAMTHLIEKILRMPESNIKGFLKISGPAYIESEKKQIIKFADEYADAVMGGCIKFAEEYYEEDYNK